MLDLSEKQVITEHDLKDAPTGGKVQLAENAILTPLARDLIGERKLDIVRRRRRGRKRVIAVGADHEHQLRGRDERRESSGLGVGLAGREMACGPGFPPHTRPYGSRRR